jgi:hypothetical protein
MALWLIRCYLIHMNHSTPYKLRPHGSGSRIGPRSTASRPLSSLWHQSSVSIITTSPQALDRDLPCRFFTTSANPHSRMQGSLSVGGQCDGVIIRAPGDQGGMEMVVSLESPYRAMCVEHERSADVIGLDQSDRMHPAAVDAP